MMEGTIIAALAMALSFIPTMIGSSFTVSLGQIPLTVYALRRGVRPAVIAGFVWGMLHFLTGQAYILNVWQALIEYPIAFPFAGFAGLFAGKVQQAFRSNNQTAAIQTVIAGALTGALARFFWHFVAGVIFWGSYALWGLSPLWFSLVTQGISGLATGVVSAVVCLVIAKTMPRLFTPKDRLPTVSS